MLCKILRLEFGETETIGTFIVAGEILGPVLELPWRDNQVNVSCIPPGIYCCTRWKSPTFGWTYRIPVVGRTDIEFHWGNTHVDTLGCPLPGTYTGWHKSRRAVLDSMRAFKEFVKRTDGRKHIVLEVEELRS